MATITQTPPSLRARRAHYPVAAAKKTMDRRSGVVRSVRARSSEVLLGLAVLGVLGGIIVGTAALIGAAVSLLSSLAGVMAGM